MVPCTVAYGIPLFWLCMYRVHSLAALIDHGILEVWRLHLTAVVWVVWMCGMCESIPGNWVPSQGGSFPANSACIFWCHHCYPGKWPGFEVAPTLALGYLFLCVHVFVIGSLLLAASKFMTAYCMVIWWFPSPSQKSFASSGYCHVQSASLAAS